MHFGMPTLIEHNSLEESSALCRELGLDFLELNMNLPDIYDALINGGKEGIGRLREIGELYGIYFTIHLNEDMNICDFNRAVTQAYLSTVTGTIQAARLLKVPVLNMHMHHGIYFTLPDKKVWLYEKYHDRYMADIRTFRSLCEEVIGDSDIRIAVENTDGYRDYEKDAIEYLLESDVFILTWDIGHSHAAGNVDEPFLRMHADRIKHFHIHDAVGGKNHLTLGDGEIDIPARLADARKQEARCVLETKTAEALKESVKWLSVKEKHSISTRMIMPDGRPQ